MFPARLVLVAEFEAALLDGIAIAETLHSDPVQNLLSLVAGLLVAPLLFFSLGKRFDRLA